jgi:hypothetical protein
MILISPFEGQFATGKHSLIVHSVSGGILMNCFILSTATILFSMMQLTHIP